MFLVGLFSWWYGRGLVSRWGHAKHRLVQTVHFFSIGQLFATLFAPYRQISADEKGDNPGTALQAFFDKTLSRFIGAIVRLFTILAGLIVLVLLVISELMTLLIWLVFPIMAIVCVVLFALGWVPLWR